VKNEVLSGAVVRPPWKCPARRENMGNWVGAKRFLWMFSRKTGMLFMGLQTNGCYWFYFFQKG